jgi:hypothetical protein
VSPNPCSHLIALLLLGGGLAVLSFHLFKRNEIKGKVGINPKCVRIWLRKRGKGGKELITPYHALPSKSSENQKGEEPDDTRFSARYSRARYI